MQSLDSVNVISHARIFLRREVTGLFEKSTWINDQLRWITEEKHSYKPVVKVASDEGYYFSFFMKILVQAAFIDFSIRK